MSDTSSAAFPGFSQFVPGFDFLQNLLKQSSSATPGVPGMGGWVAPTLSVEDLEKRIQELKAVQFWLDQNANLLKATIQAMEVQKMTLATLHSMNVNMADMAQAFSVKPDSANTPPATPRSAGFGFVGTAPAAAPAPFFPSWVPPVAGPVPTAPVTAAPSDSGSAPAGVVDAMQWWGALTQQFQTIAANAMKDLGTPAPVSSGQVAPETGFAPAAPAPAPVTETARPSTEAAVPQARAAGKSDLRHRAWPTPGASAPSTDTSATSPHNTKAAKASAGSKGQPPSES